MGEIKKQSIKNNYYILLGLFFGILSRAFIIPRYIEPEIIGTLDYIISLGTILSAIFVFGTPMVIQKEFPKYLNSSKWNSFSQYTRKISLMGCAVGLIVFFFYYFLFIAPNVSDKLDPYILCGALVVYFSKLIFSYSDAYLRIFKNSTSGAFYLEFVTKALFFSILILFILHLIDQYNLLLLTVSSYVFIALMITKKVIKNAKKKKETEKYFDEIDTKDKKNIKEIAFYSLLTVIGSVIILEIDRIMLFQMLGSQETGIYTSMFFFGMVVSIPSRGIKRITASYLSEYWESKNKKGISDIYSKTALIQLIMGAMIFLLVYFSLDYILPFMKSDYQNGKYIVLFIGLAKLSDMATGANYELISTSVKYKFNTYSLLILFIAVIIFNLILIPKYGSTGAALGSFLSILVLNVWRMIYIKYHFQLSPINTAYLKVMLLTCTCFSALYFIENLDLQLNAFTGLITNLLLVGCIIILPIYFFNISEDVKRFIDNKLFKKE